MPPTPPAPESLPFLPALPYALYISNIWSLKVVNVLMTWDALPISSFSEKVTFFLDTKKEGTLLKTASSAPSFPLCPFVPLLPCCPAPPLPPLTLILNLLTFVICLALP